MTLSESARELLTGWSPPDDSQRVLRDEFLAHIAAHRRPWSRDCLPDHLTASALVVDPTRSRVLLGLHRKVGLWLQFGGHIEPADASVADAALREALEESGLSTIALDSSQPLRLDRHLAPCGPGAGHHLDVQLLGIADPAAPVTVSEESLGVGWFDADRLPPQTDDAVRRLVAAARSS
jgi:8-oxo-dGTP pyrophosphatase MutT (NUDIX family)